MGDGPWLHEGALRLCRGSGIGRHGSSSVHGKLTQGAGRAGVVEDLEMPADTHAESRHVGREVLRRNDSNVTLAGGAAWWYRAVWPVPVWPSSLAGHRPSPHEHGAQHIVHCDEASPSRERRRCSAGEVGRQRRGGAWR
jgi:hypothetical protein